MKRLFLTMMITGTFIAAGYTQKGNVKPTENNTATVNPDAIKYDTSNKEEEIAVDGKDVVISGHDNKLTFTGKIRKLLISGKDNDIYTQSVEQIVITGNGNFVSWEKSSGSGGKPVIQDKGGYNNVERRSDNAQDRSDN